MLLLRAAATGNDQGRYLPQRFGVQRICKTPPHENSKRWRLRATSSTGRTRSRRCDGLLHSKLLLLLVHRDERTAVTHCAIALWRSSTTDIISNVHAGEERIRLGNAVM